MRGSSIVAHTLVIANPRAGSAELGETLEHAAKEHGWEWRWTCSKGEATGLARDAASHGVARIIAAGGDGTAHEIVQGILETDARPVVGVLPLGTGNDLVRTLGFPLDAEAVLAALTGETDVRRMDLARAEVGGHERILVNGSAAGFSGEVDRALDDEAKARWGAWAYMRAALDVLADLPRYELSARVDGQALEKVACIGLTVMNGRTCGGGMQVAPSARLEDGKLDLLVIEEATRLALAGVAAQLRTGGVLDNKNVRHYVGARIELTSGPLMPFNVDGELIGDVQTARFEVLPGELPIVVGPDYDAG